VRTAERRRPFALRRGNSQAGHGGCVQETQLHDGQWKNELTCLLEDTWLFYTMVVG
jgi:hypothetical protein